MKKFISSVKKFLTDKNFYRHKSINGISKNWAFVTVQRTPLFIEYSSHHFTINWGTSSGWYLFPSVRLAYVETSKKFHIIFQIAFLYIKLTF